MIKSLLPSHSFQSFLYTPSPHRRFFNASLPMDNFESSRSSIDTSGDTLDPLSYVIRPSPTETPAERLVRLLHEAEAKTISDAIDEELERQAIAERNQPKTVKILLLGKRVILIYWLDMSFKSLCNPCRPKRVRCVLF